MTDGREEDKAAVGRLVSEEEWQRLFERWVEPLYLQLVDWSVLDADRDSRHAFVQAAAEAAAWFGEHTARTLYSLENWRSRMVASFLWLCRPDLDDLSAWLSWSELSHDHGVHARLLAYAAMDADQAIWRPAEDPEHAKAYRYAALLNGGLRCQKLAKEIAQTDYQWVSTPDVQEAVRRTENVRALVQEIRTALRERSSTKRQPSRPTPWWSGQPSLLKANDVLADRAKAGDWAKVLSILDGLVPPWTPNLWRGRGSSLYTPLHHAAWHGAPVNVVEALLARGAWRTLRTAAGQRAVDIAAQHQHAHLLELLEPVVARDLPLDVLTGLDEQLAALIDSRIRPRITAELRHPVTEVLTELPDGRLWYPVDGMYGGFSIQLRENHLYVESWSRVVGGSGKAHVVTTKGFTLVNEGFV